MAKKPLSTSTSTNTISTFINAIPTSKPSRIPAIYLDELTTIWDTDKRTPSAASRRAWALARNLSPVKVNNWWYRKRSTARKHGIVLPEESYELPVGIIVVGAKCSTFPVPDPPKSSSESIDLNHVKKEEIQPEQELILLSGSDDSNFGTSGSSDVVGSFAGSDDNNDKYSVGTSIPYSFFPPDGFDEETFVDKRYGAYCSPVREDYPGIYMLSQLNDSGLFESVTGVLSCSDVVTGQNIIPLQDIQYRDAGLSSSSCCSEPATTNQTNAFLQQQPDFICALRIPVDPLCASNTGLPVPDNEFDEMVWQSCQWDTPESLEMTTTRPVLTTTEAVVQKQQDWALQNPNDFSWCLGGVRYSYDGFHLGLCECSGADTKFKRYLGCTGPWGVL